MEEMAWRLGLAFVAGALVGFEREHHGRAAGLRTTVLACMASSIAMILSEHLFHLTAGAAWRPDPARLAAGILTGIGFLGAGCIIRHENAVRGVTTAAVLWFVAILGLAFGSGYLLLGMIGTLVALVVLFVIPYFEHHLQQDWYAKVAITLDMNAVSDHEIRAKIEKLGLKIKQVDMEYDLPTQQKTLVCSLKFKKNHLFDLTESVVQALIQQPGVRQVKWT